MSVLLILESPHVDEMERSIPAVGETGRAISRFFLGREDVPFSLFIQNPCISLSLGLPDVTHIGIMNVSTFPLQAAGYSEAFKDLMPSNIPAFERVKGDLEKEKRTKKKKFDDEKMEEAQQRLYRGFERRLRYCAIRSGQLALVPCGHIARYFVGWFLSENPCLASVLNVVEDVPHPSRNGWISLAPEVRSSLIGLLHAEQSLR